MAVDLTAFAFRVPNSACGCARRRFGSFLVVDQNLSEFYLHSSFFKQPKKKQLMTYSSRFLLFSYRFLFKLLLLFRFLSHAVFLFIYCVVEITERPK